MIEEAKQQIEPAPYLPLGGWCVDGLIPADGQVLITGTNRDSIRLLAMDLSLSVAARVKALGRYTTCPGPVLYVTWGDMVSTARTLLAWSTWQGLATDHPILWACPAGTFDLTTTTGMEDLVGHCSHWCSVGLDGQPLSLLVLDSPPKIKPTNLARLRQQLGCPVLVTQCEAPAHLREASDVVLHVNHPARRNATHLVLQRQLPAGQPLRLTLRKAYLPDGSVTRILWPTR
jgi:hypothetical protein